ncbi:hypothetical protein LTR56_005804 [Elasticomyces elasticus]|nr:hypothetical protein LTR22_019438 [Elasticomyces elasticus]KAK3651347.1 hypothetical protein LTR56_005804 [Elasticomyces elasticus]KAK4925735.1 hypothetical protein LTR49_007345 [Elasticomyces elasticus]KAK5765067.1 hypothetical protein LTS12_004845 [Elasticomyces elasticus]
MTDLADVWQVVLSEGCWEANPGLLDCPDERGGTFTRNQSTSWSTERLPNAGLLQLNSYEENFLGLSGSAYYGFDTVTLGIDGEGLPTLQNQLVAGIATDNYFLGSLGLSPISFNISDLNSPIPSILGVLRNESLVPSLSWAYSVGSAYSSPRDYGSLVFGGYDASLLDKTNAISDVPFSGDTSRDLQLQVQSITYDTLGSTPLLTESIDVFIDSMVTQLWLPTSVCTSFETAFNLTWNSSQQLYLVDVDIHTALSTQNPTFTFNLASHAGGNLSIVLPYAAFDLKASVPMVDSESYYFPLQRAENVSRYTLGRVFLQEAYVIADYDRHSFSVSRKASTSGDHKLLPICAPGNPGPCGSGSLSAGAKAGIAIGAVAIAGLIASLLWLWWRSRARKGIQDVQNTVPYTGHDEKKHAHERESFIRPVELGTREAEIYEMDRANEFRPELPSQSKHHEIGTRDVPAVELEAPLK